MKENKRICFECGSSPVNDPKTTLLKSPKPASTNILRCELCAKYCCPDKPWSNKDFQFKLHTEHRMLCHRHFKETAFVDFPSKKLRLFASSNVEFENRVSEWKSGSGTPYASESAYHCFRNLSLKHDIKC